MQKLDFEFEAHLSGLVACLGRFQFLVKNARVVQVSSFNTFPCTLSRPVGINHHLPASCE